MKHYNAQLFTLLAYRTLQEEGGNSTRLPTFEASSDTTGGSSDGSLNACDDQEWELMTLQSAWDRCSIQSLKGIDRLKYLDRVQQYKS